MDERLNLMLDEREVARMEQLRFAVYDADGSQRARGPLSRGDVARLAIDAGLAVLETRYGIDPDLAEFAAEQAALDGKRAAA